MVASCPKDATPSPAELVAYLADIGRECAALSTEAGRPEAAVLFLRAVVALDRPQPPPKAAPGDAA